MSAPIPRAVRLAGQRLPPCDLGHPEDPGPLARILVPDERIEPGLWHTLRERLVADLRPAFLEGVEDVLEEYQAQDEILVLRSVHRAAELTGGPPQHLVQIGHGGPA